MNATLKDARVLQVAARPEGGGANQVAYQLHCEMQRRGLDSWLAVGSMEQDYPRVVPVPNRQYRGGPARVAGRLASGLKPLKSRFRGMTRAAELLARAGEPGRALGYLRGHEDFDHPGTRHVFDLLPGPPSLVHCHNLHGGYFDLRVLPDWSARFPVVLHLHDAWTLTGHGAYPMACPRWRTGCGKCPDLRRPPGIMADGTAFNWRRKRAIWAAGNFHLAAPSQWILDMAMEGILAAGCKSARVLPNFADTEVFRPGDKQAARAELDLPPDRPVVLFAAACLTSSPYKDYPTFRAAIEWLATRGETDSVLAVCLGEEHDPVDFGNAAIEFRAFCDDRHQVARYHRAADLYVHAARTEVFGLVIVEAMCCGTPVVAPAVGGIPEIVAGLGSAELEPELNRSCIEEATGLLAQPEDPVSLGRAIDYLLTHTEAREYLAENARTTAPKRFNLDSYMRRLTEWYTEILDIREGD